MSEAIRLAAEALLGNARWMAANLVLALLPVVVATLLFWPGRPGRPRRSPLWLLGLPVFVALLPNAPYLLTDVVHLFGDVRAIDSPAVLALAVLPQYVLFVWAGLQCYVLSLLLFTRWLEHQGWGRWVGPAECTAHLLCGLGIFLGRVHRLNSWDLARPQALSRALNGIGTPEVVALVVITAVVLLVTHTVLKQTTLALANYYRVRLPPRPV